MIKLLNRIALGLGWSILCFFGISVLGVITLIVVFSDKDKEVSASVENSVAVVELTGEILSSKQFRKDMLKQRDNENIETIVVRIDSPGGAVGASEELFRVIRTVREKKPVVCSLGSIAASGGLYAAVGCEKIVTNKGTLTGSIGVVMMMPNFHTIFSTLGLKMNVIKSGQLKDSGSPFREMTEADRSILQKVVNQAFEQFVSVVAEGRGLDVNKVREFADGRIIVGEEAIALGLADEVGGVERAAKLSLELKGLSGEPHIVYPKKKSGFMRILDDVAESRVWGWLDAMGAPQLRYQLL